MAIGKSLIPRAWEQIVSSKLAELNRRVRSLEVNTPSNYAPTGQIKFGRKRFTGNDTDTVSFSMTMPVISPPAPTAIFVASPVGWAGEIHVDGVTDDGVHLSLVAIMSTGAFSSETGYFYDYFVGTIPPPLDS